MAEEIKYAMTLKGKANPPGHRLIAGVIEGAINALPVAYMEFTARNKALDLSELVGSEMGFWFEDENSKRQPFWGICIAAEAKGAHHGDGLYVAEIRPALWFLTRSRNNRIYQNMKTTAIVQDILGDYGFSGDLKVNHSGTDPEREYCVQYRETDLDFIKRLLEEDGFYFYFEHEDGAVKMVLADQPSTHGAVTEDDKYLFLDERAEGARERVIKWNAVEKAVTGKVTLRDYDFTKPSSDLTAASLLESGSHSHKSYEAYRYPGGYTDVSEGEKRAAALVEAEAAGHQRWHGEGTIANLNVGKLFELIDHPRHSTPALNGFMATKVKQFFRTRTAGNESVASVLQAAHAAGIAGHQHFQTVFEAVLKSKAFRMPMLTPRPEMTGLQTAIVTGASGDEITVDKYGRIKVQFHWDRDGKNDDKTTCWVRTMMPWTGKNWGMVALPRVGQEVVIQFLEGDPDRPLCTGMLYNADTMPPYELPGNATRTGIKTNSSKGGGGYNELMFEDKKGEELVRFEAEKDYTQTVQNAAHIRVGYPHDKDKKKAEAQDVRSMKLEVENHLDEIVEKGDHSFSVKAGEQKIDIKKDKTEVIEGKSTLTVTEDVAETVKQGNVTQTVSLGNLSTTVNTGNISVDAALGKVAITAMQEISLTVGGSSVVIDQMGVTIKGMNVKVNGTIMVAVSGLTTEVKGSAMLTLRGGVTMIN
tara:strand:- start:97569 stop:99671 length:2103 start_codon:yes stop_codon:yes gene_type:complete